MNNLQVLIIVLIVLISNANFAQALNINKNLTSQGSTQHTVGRIIQFRNYDPERVKSIYGAKLTPLFNMSRGNISLKRKLGMDRIYVLRGLTQLSALNADLDIERIEFDDIGYGAVPIIPTDSSFSSQWALNNQSNTDINAPEAWELTTGVTSTLIAIIDSGIDFSHPDLTGKISSAGYDFANNDSNPQDDHGHGTHVAGIAAAKSNNQQGVAGVCWACSILPIKALNNQSWGYYSWWTQGIEHAVDHGANIINMSMGGSSYSSSMHTAIQYAYASRVPVVVAMMNFGNEVTYYPAGYSEVIAVGNTTNSGTRNTSSNYGAHIHISAPGTSILSTMINSTYASWTGTSMAAPHVAGVLGLLHGLNPALTVNQYKQVLRDSARDQIGLLTEDTTGWDKYHGYGLLDARKAMIETKKLLTQPRAFVPNTRRSAVSGW